MSITLKLQRRIYRIFPQNIHIRVARAIASRLIKAPEEHGVPLRGTLKGYWKLRVGDYRVVYKIMAAEVWIFGIIHRKKIYDDVVRRLRLASSLSGEN